MADTEEQKANVAAYKKGKPPYQLLPPDAEEEVVGAFARGAEDYGDRDWEYERFPKYLELYAAIRRHGSAWARGEDIDPKSKRHHMAHVAANAMMLVAYYLRGIIINDDRKAQNLKKETLVTEWCVGKSYQVRVNQRWWPGTLKVLTAGTLVFEVAYDDCISSLHYNPHSPEDKSCSIREVKP